MSCSHRPPIENSKLVKPVTLPSGRARFVTYPAETASGTCTNTIGIDKVYCRSAVTASVVAATITSGRNSTNSFTCFWVIVASPSANRISIRKLRPPTQPSCCKPARNSDRADCASRSFSARQCVSPAPSAAPAPRSAKLQRHRPLSPLSPVASCEPSELQERCRPFWVGSGGWPTHSITSSARC